MPTGYTAAVEEDGISFEQFAMRCARAFGALALLRDEPLDAPIPEELKPSDWHSIRAQEAQARLDQLESMPFPEIETAALHSYLNEHENWKKYNREQAVRNDKHRAMLAQVTAWTPPTEDHKPMQRFMVEQLEVSISKYATPEPQQRSALTWLADESASAMRDVAYHNRKHAEEVALTAERNDWLRALRASLKGGQDV